MTYEFRKRSIIIFIIIMIAATALTVEEGYYFVNTFGPEDKNDPIITAGGLNSSPEGGWKGKVTNLAALSIGRNDYAALTTAIRSSIRYAAERT